MREAAALAVLEAGPDCPHIIAAVAAIRDLRIPAAPALPGIDLAAIEGRAAAAAPGPWTLNGDDDRASGEPALICTGPTVVAVIQFDGTDDDAAFIAAARADVPTLCAAHRSLITQRDAWVRAAFSVACDGPDQLAARLAALVAERDALRSAAEGWERQAHEVEGRYEGACEERERMRGAMGEARRHLTAWLNDDDNSTGVSAAFAALISAGQERAKRRLDHADDCALSPTAPCDCGIVPTPEEMATTLYGTSEGFSVGCLRDAAAAGIRAERARRGTAPVQPVPTAEEPNEDEHMLTCAYYTSFAGDADSMCDCGVRTRRGGSHA